MECTFYLYFTSKEMLQVALFKTKVSLLKKLGLQPKITKVFSFKHSGKIAVSWQQDGSVEFEVEEYVDTSDCECRHERCYNEGYE